LRFALPVHRLVLLDGRKRAAAAVLAGAVSALAMPPYDLWPVLFLTFPILVLLIDGTAGGRDGVKAAAIIGFSFGFGYFLAGLWWIGAAFFVPGDNYQWMMPFAVIGLPLFLALFPAFGCALARLMWSNGPARFFALAFGLGLSEWLRGRVLTGFPWNEFGYALANNPLIGQSASLIGVEGLTLVAIAIFATPASLAGDSPRRWRPVIAACAVLAVLAGFGAARLALAGQDSATNVRVRIMQPNIAQDDKFRPSAKDQIMARYLALSDRRTSPERSGMADVDVLIWPESAFPFFLAKTPDALAQIGALLPDNAVLLTGAARLDEDGAPQSASGRRRVFNAIHALGDDGSIIATYDKVHLVPGGEFLPFQSFLESLGLRQLTRLPGGFSAGSAPKNIVLPNGVKLGPLICYEAIFPTGVYDPEERPDALVNVTNDGWFGDTAGPHQHFAQARVRAVEQGLPLIRAANTGISAVIDPWGRILTQMPVGDEGVIDALLPSATSPTVYHQFGLALLILLYIATIVGALYPLWRV
jgi:apolipoprotein N-acyltransferase